MIVLLCRSWCTCVFLRGKPFLLIFNLVNDPPPSDSILEDGMTDNAGGKRGTNRTDSTKKKRRSPNKTGEVKEMTDGVAGGESCE